MAERARAAVLVAPHTLEVRDLPVPEVGDDDAILRVEACGLCGTDHEQFTGSIGAGAPFVPGHESVGTIEVIGPGAAARWGVGPGDRVAVEVFQSCGDCEACRSGDTRHCDRHGSADLYGFIPLGRPPGLWGGYATHQYLSPVAALLPVPDGLDPVIATLFNPVGAGIRWGATLGGITGGETVAVLGPGIRGLAACAAAREAGAGFVMVTGHGPRDVDRLALAAGFGADLAVDSSATDAGRALRDATGRRGADVVIDVTANAPAAFTQAIGLAREGGRVVVAGTRGFVEAPGFHPDLVVYRELSIVGALGVDTASYTAALGMIASRRWPFEQVPREVVGLHGAAALLTRMAGGSDEAPPVHGVIAPWA